MLIFMKVSNNFGERWTVEEVIRHDWHPTIYC